MYLRTILYDYVRVPNTSGSVSKQPSWIRNDTSCSRIPIASGMNAGVLLRQSFALSICLYLLSAGALLCNAQVFLRSTPASSQTSAPASDRSLAALDLAIKAAEAGIPDVSMEAVRRAVGAGPPVSAVNLGGLLGPGGQPSVVYSTGLGGTPPADDSRQKLTDKLQQVNEAWKAQKLDPKQCYEAWKQIIFPADRPSEAFTYAPTVNQSGYSYSFSLTEKEPSPITCGAMNLLDWAERAECIDDLQALIAEREAMPGAAPTVHVLRLALAEKDDTTNKDALCDSLTQSVASLVTGNDAPLLMSLTYRMLNTLQHDSPARKKLWDAIAQQASGTQRWASNTWLRYAVANEAMLAIERGDTDGFKRESNLLLSILDPLTGNEEYKASQTTSYYASAMEKAFEADQLELGLLCLKLRSAAGARSLTGSGSSAANSLMDLNSKTYQRLFDLGPEKRYEILFDLAWSLPRLGLDSASKFAPTDVIPQRFVDNYKAYRKTERLPLEYVTSLGGRSVNLLEWVMRDAIALGRIDEVTERIAELEANNSDDANFAKLLLAKATDQPIDLSLVQTKTEDGTLVLRSDVSGDRGRLSALDIELAELAISNPETHKQGEELAERIAARTLANRSDEVLFGRMLTAKAKLASSEPPVTSDALKHFVKSDDFDTKTLVIGRPNESLWFKNADGFWEHQMCAMRSSLLLKYPLQGDFKISFECMDNTYAESAATFGGVYIDFRGYLKDVAIDVVGLRKGTSAPAEVQAGQKNSVLLERKSSEGMFTLTVNEKYVADFRIAEDEFPFFGPHSMMHRVMALENIKIEGNVKIPRALNLLTPRLIGWSNLFQRRALPPIDQLESFQNSEDSGQADAEQTEASHAPEPSADEEIGEKSAILTYDWHVIDDVLESIDHSALHKIDVDNGLETKKRWHRPHEQWLYYGRPLCEGETFSFEFYEEANRYSIHPTIDRIAVLLKTPKIQQHWITSNASLYGVSPTNHLDAPQDTLIATPKLNEKGWNKIALRRQGGKIILAVNDQDVYQQVVDAAYGGRFGFMQDPEKFQVRIRNATLTGDWPESLPEDLFEEM